jgi:hypothetical protein
MGITSAVNQHAQSDKSYSDEVIYWRGQGIVSETCRYTGSFSG